MPVKRRLHKGREHRITEDVLEAWRRRDDLALHRALGFHPWQASPLPLEVTALGCDQRTPDENAAMEYKYRLWNDSWPLAQELQRELLKVAGEPPACR